MNEDLDFKAWLKSNIIDQKRRESFIFLSSMGVATVIGFLVNSLFKLIENSYFDNYLFYLFLFLISFSFFVFIFYKITQTNNRDMDIIMLEQYKKLQREINRRYGGSSQ